MMTDTGSQPDAKHANTAFFLTAMCGCVFFLMGGYELMRVAVDSLFIAKFGAKKMPYAMTAIPFVTAAAIYVYARILSAFGPRRTTFASFLGAALVFSAMYFSILGGAAWPVAILYPLREVYIVLLYEQCWSLVNSMFTRSQAKFFNGIILTAASAGNITFAFLLKNNARGFGTDFFIFLAALSAIPALFFIMAAYKTAGEPVREKTSGQEGYLHLSLFRENRTLLMLLFMIMLSQAVSTAVNLKFFQTLETAFPLKDLRTEYMGGFWIITSSATIVMQSLLSPMILRRIPLKTVMIAVPLITMASAGYFMAHPVLPAAALAFGLFKCVDYSVFRAGKEIIYIPLSFDARYRAKQIIDSFAYRLSKGATAGAFSLWAVISEVPAMAAPAAAIAACAGWVFCAFKLETGD